MQWFRSLHRLHPVVKLPHFSSHSQERRWIFHCVHSKFTFWLWPGQQPRCRSSEAKRSKLHIQIRRSQTLSRLHHSAANLRHVKKRGEKKNRLANKNEEEDEEEIKLFLNKSRKGIYELFNGESRSLVTFRSSPVCDCFVFSIQDFPLSQVIKTIQMSVNLSLRSLSELSGERLRHRWIIDCFIVLINESLGKPHLTFSCAGN